MGKSSTLFVGLAIHKDGIDVAVAHAPRDDFVRHVGTTGGDLASPDKALRRLVSRGQPLHVVYEAGPRTFVIWRHLTIQVMNSSGCSQEPSTARKCRPCGMGHRSVPVLKVFDGKWLRDVPISSRPFAGRRCWRQANGRYPRSESLDPFLQVRSAPITLKGKRMKKFIPSVGFAALLVGSLVALTAGCTTMDDLYAPGGELADKAEGSPMLATSTAESVAAMFPPTVTTRAQVRQALGNPQGTMQSSDGTTTETFHYSFTAYKRRFVDMRYLTVVYEKSGAVKSTALQVHQSNF